MPSKEINTREKLTQNSLYPLGDFLSDADGFKLEESRSVMAMATGVKRKPKAGEWYLSGAIITAYKAKADLLSPYHIAKLVRTETVTITRVLP